MEDCARGICFVLRENDVLLVDNLYSWYSNMDWESFSHRCSEILQTALSDNARAYAHLDAVLRGDAIESVLAWVRALKFALTVLIPATNQHAGLCSADRS